MLHDRLHELRREYDGRTILMKEMAMYTLFIVGGWNDATPGALLPSIQNHYRVGFVVTSTLFVCSFAGSMASAALCPLLVDRFGFGRSLTVFSGLVLVPWLAWIFLPPFPVFALGFLLSGIAVSSMDSLANAWMMGRPRPALRLGALHFAYGLGALLSPCAAIPFNQGTRPFSHFYILAMCLALGNLILILVAFRLKRDEEPNGLPQENHTLSPGISPSVARIDETQEDITLRTMGPERQMQMEENIAIQTDVRREHILSSPSSPTLPESTGRKLRQVVKKRDVHILAMFTLFYVGCEVSIGGWTSSYLLRQNEVWEGGMTITRSQANGLVAGFWAGIAAGRILMIPVTGFLGGRFAVFAYLVCAVVLQLLLWKAPHIATDAVTLPLMGLLLGPLYPVMIEVASLKIRPRSLHTAAIAYIGSFGACGSALFPFGIGLIAQQYGIEVLAPILTAMLVTQSLIWLFLWGLRKRPQNQTTRQE